MFADALRSKLEADPDLMRQNRRLYRILTGPDTPQRRRWLKVCEHAVRAQQGLSDTDAIDWSTIDWKMVFKVVVGLLSLLSLFL